MVKRTEREPGGSVLAAVIAWSVAEVSNHLDCGSEYNLGDEAVFEGRHIYAVKSAPGSAAAKRVKDVIP